RAKYRVLSRPITLWYHGGHLLLSAKQSQVRVDVDALVDEALARSHNGWFVSRAWRELTGGRGAATLRRHVAYAKAAGNQATGSIENGLERDPVDATLSASYSGLQIKGGENGAEVKVARLRWQIRHALLTRFTTRSFKVMLRAVEPDVTIETLRKDYPSYIT